jgi:hypothetical protein
MKSASKFGGFQFQAVNGDRVLCRLQPTVEARDSAEIRCFRPLRRAAIATAADAGTRGKTDRPCSGRDVSPVLSLDSGAAADIRVVGALLPADQRRCEFLFEYGLGMFMDSVQTIISRQ